MRRSTAILIAILMAAGCREGDGPADPSAIDARVLLISEPNGAAITVDNRATGQVTPDTVSLRRGDRVISLDLDTAGNTYSYRAILRVQRTDEVDAYTLPLALRCLDASCFAAAQDAHTVAGVTFYSSGTGSLFHRADNSRALVWPEGTLNSYIAAGMPLFAARANDRPVALGVYDQEMLVGRPAPVVTRGDGSFALAQETWIIPPSSPFINPNTLRGVAVEEVVTASDAAEGVLVLRLTFRNITNDPLAHALATHIAPASVTYTDAWIGFGLDPDIGNAADDWVSYDPALDMVFAYDSNFSESQFTTTAANSPGLVGLRVLEAPPGTSVLLNSWPINGDWEAGTPTEQAGFGMLTGSTVYSPQHADPKIGYMPPSRGDMRISATVGPMTLAPGDSATVVLALAIAAPAGSFVSGNEVAPGDPFDTARQLFGIAANLRAKAAAAAAGQ